MSNPMTFTEKNPAANNSLLLNGVDDQIQTIAKAMESITWLEKSFGRAKNVNRKQLGLYTKVSGAQYVDNLPSNEPMIYLSEKEYYSTYPNDTFKSYSFWGVQSPQVGKDQINIVQSNMNFQSSVFCIVWADLKKIDKTKDYIYTQDLIKDVLNILKRQSSFILTQIIDEKVEDIFRGYTLNPDHRDLLMYPFQAFRIEGTLNYSLKLC